MDDSLEFDIDVPAHRKPCFTPDLARNKGPQDSLRNGVPEVDMYGILREQVSMCKSTSCSLQQAFRFAGAVTAEEAALFFSGDFGTLLAVGEIFQRTLSVLGRPLLRIERCLVIQIVPLQGSL